MTGHDEGRTDWRNVLDTVQIVAVIGLVIDLALPWWSSSDSADPPVGTFTGWASLTKSGGWGWAAIIGIALVAAGRLSHRSSVLIGTGVVAIAGVVLTLASAYRVHGFHPPELNVLAGMWVGLVLVAVSAAVNLVEAILPDRTPASGGSGTRP